MMQAFTCSQWLLIGQKQRRHQRDTGVLSVQLFTVPVPRDAQHDCIGALAN